MKRELNELIDKEWLITNGIGGFASSSVIGANTRRYHGLLIAPLLPPARRHLLISNHLSSGISIDFPAHLHQKPYKDRSLFPTDKAGLSIYQTKIMHDLVFYQIAGALFSRTFLFQPATNPCIRLSSPYHK